MIRRVSITKSAANRSQMAMMTLAAIQFVGFACAITACALSRHSAITGFRDHLQHESNPQRHQHQIIQVAQHRYEIRYQIYGAERIPTRHAAKSFAYEGTLGSCAAK